MTVAYKKKNKMPSASIVKPPLGDRPRRNSDSSLLETIGTLPLSLGSNSWNRVHYAYQSCGKE
jgi:hypothetical protein